MQKQLLTSRLERRVQFYECDPLQIVWHGNYLKYFEEGREAFCRQHGLSYLDAKSNGFATPIVKSLCEHKLPLQYGDVFTIETTFQPCHAAKMHFNYKLILENKVICIGETVQVFLGENRELILTNPPFFLDWKKNMEFE